VPTLSSDLPAGILGDYIGYVAGAHLYVRAYGETHDYAGGMSPEGGLYASSDLGEGMMALICDLRSAGYDDPAVYGENVAIGSSQFWKTDLPNSILQIASPKAVA